MGGIKTGEIIYASDIDALKTQINFIYSNRRSNLPTNGETTLTLPEITTTFNSGEFIGSNLYNLLNNILIINNVPSLISNTSGKFIAETSINNELLTTLSTDPWIQTGATND